MKINLKHPSIQGMTLGELKHINDSYRKRRLKKNK